MREIGKHVGLRSSSSVHAHLMKLREQGYLEQETRKTRSLVVKGVAAAVPQVPILGRVTAGAPILATQAVGGKAICPMSLRTEPERILPCASWETL